MLVLKDEFKRIHNVGTTKQRNMILKSLPNPLFFIKTQPNVMTSFISTSCLLSTIIKLILLNYTLKKMKSYFTIRCF